MHNTAAEIFCFGNTGRGRWSEALYVRGQYAKSSSPTVDEHQPWRADSLRNISISLAIRKTAYADLKISSLFFPNLLLLSFSVSSTSFSSSLFFSSSFPLSSLHFSSFASFSCTSFFHFLSIISFFFLLLFLFSSLLSRPSHFRPLLPIFLLFSSFLFFSNFTVSPRFIILYKYYPLCSINICFTQFFFRSWNREIISWRGCSKVD